MFDPLPTSPLTPEELRRSFGAVIPAVIQQLADLAHTGAISAADARRRIARIAAS